LPKVQANLLQCVQTFLDFGSRLSPYVQVPSGGAVAAGGAAAAGGAPAAAAEEKVEEKKGEEKVLTFPFRALINTDPFVNDIRRNPTTTWASVSSTDCVTILSVFVAISQYYTTMPTLAAVCTNLGK
jgi:hypothetical protein